VQIDIGCCDEMLHDALAAGCRYDEEEMLAYTAAVATELALQPEAAAQSEFVCAGWTTLVRTGCRATRPMRTRAGGKEAPTPIQSNKEPD
jgi:hypothetical protein